MTYAVQPRGSVLCGAYTASNLAKELGKNISPEQARMSGFEPDRPAGIGPNAVEPGLERMGLDAERQPSAQSSYNNLKNGGKEFFAVMQRDPQTGQVFGHAVAGKGVDSQGNVVYVDPIDGQEHRERPEEFYGRTMGAWSVTA